jgi:hypothetical protein
LLSSVKLSGKGRLESAIRILHSYKTIIVGNESLPRNHI